MKQTLNMRQQLSVNVRYCYLSRRTTQKYVGEWYFVHHWCKPTRLNAINSRCLTALPAKMFALNSHMRQNISHRQTWTI